MSKSLTEERESEIRRWAAEGLVVGPGVSIDLLAEVDRLRALLLAPDPGLYTRLAQVEARAAEATPGEWYRSGYAVRGADLADVAVVDTTRGNDAPRNAAFIAASRSDVPYLCAQVRALLGVLGDLQEDAGKKWMGTYRWETVAWLRGRADEASGSGDSAFVALVSAADELESQGVRPPLPLDVAMNRVAALERALTQIRDGQPQETGGAGWCVLHHRQIARNALDGGPGEVGT